MVRIMVRCSVAGELPPSSAPPLKKLRRPYVVKDDDEEEILDTVYEEETTFNAAFDMGILRCDGCSSSLSAPIYQCSNGHLACSICHFRESNECLNCFEKIGNIRCLVVEKLIESLRVSCEHEL
ncbi:hypothetical protein O6H91_09G049300 [Diphasiastrum complanatum]|uniref:Uncharacterized protein n=1 Tax=Diphasiastrum complanatum TaxID=34168 RepID=A0ACC2CNU7_DIPCM|nr:hypothetical protein O6H91_09G049300 [Diphasiastrum complanatum]